MLSAESEAPDPVPFLQVIRARPADTPAVLAMVRRCSPTSLFHRFHGPTDGLSYTDTVLRRGGDIIFLAWEESRCAGMAQLGGGPASVPHLGVLVEDERQRRGIGTRLVMAVASEARRRGVRFMHADVLGEDGRLLAALGRLGPTQVDLHMGTYSVDIDLMPSNRASPPKLSAVLRLR
jgi:GNAT superfamily N-acetyltransferase